MTTQTDILNNGELVKTTLKTGLGRETRPHRGDLVTILYSGMLEDGTEVIPETEVTITIGDCDIVDAIDLSLPLCDLKEKYSVQSSPRFSFGSIGLEPSIPPNSKLTYHVELLRSTEPPVYELMEASKRISIADRKRERGNYYYRRKEYQYALTVYDKAISILVNDQEMATPDAMDLILKLWNNIAACNLKLENYSNTIEYCEKILKESPLNFKANYRMGRARLLLGEPVLALKSFELLLQIDPDSQLAISEIQRAKNEISHQSDRFRKAMKTYYSKKNAEYIKDFENIIPEDLFTTNSRFSTRWIIVSVLVLLFALIFGYLQFQRTASSDPVPNEFPFQANDNLTAFVNITENSSNDTPITHINSEEQFDKVMSGGS